MAKTTRETPHPPALASVPKTESAPVFSTMDALTVQPADVTTTAKEPPQKAGGETLALPAVTSLPPAPETGPSAGIPIAEYVLYWPWYCTFVGMAFIYRSWSNCLPARHLGRQAMNDAMGFGS